MADDLNPYRTWLNVASDAQPPNHYELLGLSPQRADPASVAEAFRRQADLITPHLTGQHVELAQQVMTELINARMVLSTPTTKKAYDAELTAAPRGKAPDSSSTPVPRPQALPPARDPQPDGAAPGADSFGPTSVDSLLPPTSGLAAAVPSASPLPLGGPASTPPPDATQPPLAAAPVNQPPVPYAAAPAVPRALPVAAAPAYGYPQPSAMPMMAQPVMAQPVRAHPVGYASPATPIMAQPVLPSAPAPVGAEPAWAVEPSTFSAPQRLQRRRTSVAPTIAGVGIAGLLVAGGVLWVVKHEKPVAQAPAGAGHLPNDGRNASRRVQGPEQPEPAKPRLPQTKPDPNEQKLFGPLPTTKPDQVPTAEKPDSSGPKPLTPPDNSKAIITTPAKTEPNSPQPTTTEPTKPAPDPPTPDPPEPKPPATEPKPPSAEEAAAVKKALATARAKLSARKPAAAQDVLAEALLSAESPESIRQIDRLDALCQYADNFWRAVRDEMSKLEAGEELTVGDQQVAIVEASQDGLTVRVAGRNHDYRLDDLPVKLALFLARRWLAEDDPQSRLVVAAFLLFDPQGDREEARRLIAEAEQSGADAAAFTSELEAASASR